MKPTPDRLEQLERATELMAQGYSQHAALCMVGLRVRQVGVSSNQSPRQVAATLSKVMTPADLSKLGELLRK